MEFRKLVCGFAELSGLQLQIMLNFWILSFNDFRCNYKNNNNHTSVNTEKNSPPTIARISFMQFNIRYNKLSKTTLTHNMYLRCVSIYCNFVLKHDVWSKTIYY